MANIKESIEIIVSESIDTIVESLTDQIYAKIYQAVDKSDKLHLTENSNVHTLVIDTNLLPEHDKKKFSPIRRR